MAADASGQHEEEDSPLSELDKSSLLKRIEKLEEDKKKLVEENLKLKDNLANHPSLKDEVRSELVKILDPVFTKTQISALIDKKVIRNWPDEDISSAITLRSLSSKCYDYLRTVKGIPLPGKSTLHERIQKFPCEPGILHSVLSLMKAKSETMAETERVAVLSFDEMSIGSEWTYDKSTDTVYEPHDKVMVFMLRGLVGNWKQPIYYNFDTSYSKDLLLNIIKEVETAGYPVVAIVHDLGPSNLHIWKDFDIDGTVGKCSFKNPFAERSIYVFADVPHLLKLIRNNFVDSGFKLRNGEHVSDTAVRELMSLKKTEYSLAHKLSEFHLNLFGQQRQRVKHAVQLLSESVSKAVMFLGEKGFIKSENFKSTAKYIELVDEWFDVMNSCRKYSDKSSRNGFGVNLDRQHKVLQEMISVTNTMRVENSRRKGLYQFQKGILLSSQSLTGLYNMMHELFGIEYILTRKLNQDCLEHFFGCIRQMDGTYDHPTPLTFKHRMRKLLSGREVELLAKKTNCNEGEFEKFTTVAPFVSTVSEEAYGTHDLDKELYMTAASFKAMDLTFEAENELDDDTEGAALPEENTPSNVIEEESLRYIGGYTARKFSHKYPFLTDTDNEKARPLKETWIEYKSRGGLYSPSTLFYSELLTMRNIFLAIHGSSLIPGKNCVTQLVEEMKLKVKNIPEEVICFFAKISIYFRMRELNRNLRMEKKKTKQCRNEEKKRRKLR